MSQLSAALPNVAIILDAWSRRDVVYAIGEVDDARRARGAEVASHDGPSTGCIINPTTDQQYASGIYQAFWRTIRDRLDSRAETRRQRQARASEDAQSRGVLSMAFETSTTSSNNFPNSTTRFPINVVCILLSPHQSVQSRAITRLLSNQHFDLSGTKGPLHQGSLCSRITSDPDAVNECRACGKTSINATAGFSCGHFWPCIYSTTGAESFSRS